jgi:hypothetical protein
VSTDIFQRIHKVSHYHRHTYGFDRQNLIRLAVDQKYIDRHERSSSHGDHCFIYRKLQKIFADDVIVNESWSILYSSHCNLLFDEAIMPFILSFLVLSIVTTVYSVPGIDIGIKAPCNADIDKYSSCTARANTPIGCPSMIVHFIDTIFLKCNAIKFLW